MKFRKLSIALLIASAISSSVFAAGPTKHDFGDVDFGYTVDQVKTAEKNCTLSLDSGDEMIFTEISGDTRSQNMYCFENNQLVGALNNIVTDHASLKDYFKDFATVDGYFKELYGNPTEEIITTDDEAILKDYDKLMAAVKSGEVMCCTIWKKNKYTITHILSNELPIDEMDSDVKKVLKPSKIAHFVLGEIAGR